MTAERIVLWRHGRTAHNHQGIFQGQLDSRLDDTGRDQASRAAAALFAEFGAPGRLVSSDLSRASDTARELASLASVPLELDAGLREVHAGAWQGHTRDEIAARWPEDFATWLAGDDLVKPGGGESRATAAERCAAALRAHAAATPAGTLVAVSHGAAVRGAMLLLAGLAPSDGPAFAVLGNAHWAVLTPRPTRWTITTYNRSA